MLNADKDFLQKRLFFKKFSLKFNSGLNLMKILICNRFHWGAQSFLWNNHKKFSAKNLSYKKWKS